MRRSVGVEKKIRLASSIIVPTLLFVLFTVSYQNYRPQESVKELLEDYKNLQYNTDDVAVKLTTDSAVETVLLNKVLPNMNYKVLQSQIDDDKAIVTLEVSNVNLDHMLQHYESNVVEQTIKPIEDDVLEASAHIDDLEVSLLVNLIDNPDIQKDYITQQIEVTLHKQGSDWVLEDSDELFKAVIGSQSDVISFEHLVRETS